MELQAKFDLKTNTPQKGGDCGIWLNLTPQEVADAISSGTGPGVPGDNGTPAQGTFKPGMIVEINASGNAEKASPCTLHPVGTDFPKLYFCVFAGNADFSFEGSVFAFLGGRFETTYYDADTYVPGHPLVVSSTPGSLANKASATDGVKHCAYVGPRAQRSSGVLDVVMPQST